MKIQLSWTTIGRPENYFFIRYIASIKAGTQIINVAASGETPNISAIKSLTACILIYKVLNMSIIVDIRPKAPTTQNT